MAVTLTTARTPRPALASLTRTRHWTLPAALVLALGCLGLSRPGLWADELATWGAVELSWPRLWRLLSNTDAVNGTYYVVLKLWTGIAGTSEVALRLPSVAAMSVAAGATALIAARLWTPNWGLAAGAAFALLPITSRYAQEARAYAMVIALATVATLLLVDGPTTARGRWGRYGACVWLLGMLNLTALLLLTAHAALLPRRGMWRGWLTTVALAGAALTPLALWGASQAAQTAWISPVSLDILFDAAKRLFGSNWTALLLCLAAATTAVSAWRHRDKVTIGIVWWATVPIVVLLGLSTMEDLWVPRYLLYVTPAWAILAVRSTARLRARTIRRGATAGLVVLLAASGAGAAWDIRRDNGHGHDTREAAAVIARHHRPGDGFAVALHEPVVPWLGRDLVARYVPAAARPRDVFAATPQRSDGLLASEYRAPERLHDVDRLWIVRYENPPDPLEGMGAKESLLRESFEVVDVMPLRGVTVALLQRR